MENDLNKKIILPLDGMTPEKALPLIKKVKDYIWGVKLNDMLDVFGLSIISTIKDMGVKVFADPKLHDIPNTVKNRIIHYREMKVDMITVHASGGMDMMKIAKDNAGKMVVLAVTVLTSLSAEECERIYGKKPRNQVSYLHDMAFMSDIDGIVCSLEEIKYIKERNMIRVIPGIRPKWYTKKSNTLKDDQKRKATPKEAIKLGADYLVIGRPITMSPNPLKALKRTIKEMEEV